MKFKSISLVLVAALVLTFAALSSQGRSLTAAAATIIPTKVATMAATMDAATIAKTTLLRVVHASPNSPHIDVYLDHGKKPAIPDLAYDDATDGYLPIPAGEHQVTITAVKDPKTVVFDAKVTFKGGSAMTVVAEGQLADKTFAVRIFTDDVSATKGKARVIVIHAIPDVGNVDVLTADFKTVVVDNLAFGSSISLDVPAGKYDLVVVPHGKKEVVFDLKGSKLDANTIYTLVATGKLTGKDAVKVKLLAYVTVPVPGFLPPPVATMAPTMAATMKATMAGTMAATPKK